MAFLVDSNILIYSYSTKFEYLRDLILNDSCLLSEISRVEVLGYHALKKAEEQYFTDLFNYSSVIVPNKIIFDKAIEIRKTYNLKLGDSIIAATALIHNLDIYTRNVSDFEKIKSLKCINPIK